MTLCVGTWKEGKKLEIVSCRAYRPDASGMRSDVSELRHRTQKQFSPGVWCVLSGEDAFSEKLSEFASGANSSGRALSVQVRCTPDASGVTSDTSCAVAILRTSLSFRPDPLKTARSVPSQESSAVSRSTATASFRTVKGTGRCPGSYRTRPV